MPPGGLQELCLNVDNPKSKDENPVCSDLMTEAGFYRTSFFKVM
jgi:hypothetical protein